MHKLYTYKQKSGQGCLVACLAYLCGVSPTHKLERTVLIGGLFRHRESYALGIAEEFLRRYRGDKVLHLLVADKHYARQLERYCLHEKLYISQMDLEAYVFDIPKTPYVVYVDGCSLGWYTHQPHFIIVLNYGTKRVKIYDPWRGKVRFIPHHKLLESIHALRDHLRYCPIVIYAN